MISHKIKVRICRYKNRIKNWFLKPTVIFYYHRVAEVDDDPHLLSVSPDNFEKQLLYLKKHFKIIELRELARNLKDGKMVNGSAVITLDDGYVDNFINALPILQKLHIPATIFITSGKVSSNDPFYWDEKTDKKDQGRALTENELRELAKSPLIEIGAHTMTHPHLSALPTEKQKYEIEESKKILENILGKSVTSFSYPFGQAEDFNDETLAIIKKAGFQTACTTMPDLIKKNSSLLTLPRRIVRDWDMSYFKNYIKNL